MCGIFGIIHSKAADLVIRRKLNTLMLEAMQVGIVRGEDSSGVFQVRNDGSIKSHKVPYNGMWFTGDSQAKNLLSNVDISVVTVGHHRAATRGSVTAANAHPFEHTNKDGNTIIGVHNGYVSNFKSPEDEKYFAVDSDWALYRIAKQGGQKAISEMEGAIALAWYESEDGKLRLFTNGKRGLYWNYVPEQDIMIFASEHEMLYWLCSDARNDIPLEDTMWTGEEDKIYVFDPENVRDFDTIEVEEKKKQKDLYQYKPIKDPRDFGNKFLEDKLSKDEKKLPANKTFQGESVSFGKEGVMALGYALGDVVDFWPANMEDVLEIDANGAVKNHPKEYNSIVGDVMFEFLDKQNRSTVEFVRAIMQGVTPAEYDNVMQVISSPGGECKCRIIGSSTISKDGSSKKCLILTRPLSLVLPSASKDSSSDKSWNRVTVPVWDNCSVTEARFKELTSKGCEMCDTPLTISDANRGLITWYGKVPYCKACSGMIELSSFPSAKNLH